jgi:5-methylthioadenosine/S-adenosylhomocysteine deaminase
MPRLIAVLLFWFFLTRGIAQNQQSFMLTGTIVTPSQVLAGGAVSIAGNKIEDIVAAAPSPGPALETGSFIFPGLIDLHDHITWNVMPRWKPNQQFMNRYEWLQTTAYSMALDGPHYELTADHELACDADRFGEIKALAGGATSVVGGLAPTYGTNDNACILGLVRNLDIDAGFDGSVLNQEKVWYVVFPFEMSLATTNEVRSGLASGAVTALIVHAGEGKPTDAAAAREFAMLARNGDGLLRPGVSVIHGTAFTASDFQQMAKAGVGLIWSPRSNIELYGATTDVRSAKAAGVKIALGPDWSPTGSDGMLEELKYAATWNEAQSPPVFTDAELVSMATSVPAHLAAADGKIGSLVKGMYADLLLIRRNGNDPYQALLHAGPADVRLVMVGGRPLYGDPDLMEKLLPSKRLEPVTICGVPKKLYIEPQAGIPETEKSLRQISQELEAELTAWGASLSELAGCDGANLNQAARPTSSRLSYTLLR